MPIVGLIIGLVIVLLVMAIVFNPMRVTASQIKAAPLPTDISFDGQEFAVQPIGFGVANIYLIKTSSGCILVDTGMPNMDRQLDVAFEKAGVDPKSIQLIVVTHGHLDHVGTITYAKSITDADVLCHQSYAERLEKGEIVPAVAQNNLGRLMEFMTSLSGTHFAGVNPDILMEDEFDLSDYGIAGKVIHTPGHSSDSVSIILDNGEALIGDMLRGKAPNIGIGMFYENEHTLLTSLEKVAAFNPSIVYLSHGTYINGLELRTAITTIKAEVPVESFSDQPYR